MKTRRLIDRVNDFFKTYFRRLPRDEGEVPAATFARALIPPRNGDPVLRVSTDGTLAGSAVTALLATAIAAANA